MTQPSIGGVQFPATFGKNGGGQITVHWGEERFAADGSVYRIGEHWLEWDWKALSLSDWDWLMTRYAALPTGFVLFTDDTRRTNVTFTFGGMTRPRYGGTFGNNYYRDVHVEFRLLFPTVN